MRIEAKDPEDYISKVDDRFRDGIERIREVILKNLPQGFEEQMSYGMIGYVVPHSVYPDGYHCDTKLPLPFLNIAAQKNFIGFYHMGIYADKELLDWFTEEYKKQVPSKLDMGKSCIRLKKPEQIPYELLGELVAKVTPDDWIKNYERSLKR